MGASAVLIGRPVLYALATGGSEEVERLLDDLKKELANDPAMCRCTCIQDVTSDLLFHP